MFGEISDRKANDLLSVVPIPGQRSFRCLSDDWLRGGCFYPDGNTAERQSGLLNLTTGGLNTALGFSVLSGNTTGTPNTAVGLGALSNNPSGFQHTALGGTAGRSMTIAYNVICIGSIGLNISSSCFIGNIRGSHKRSEWRHTVIIDSAGQLGTASS